MMISGALSPVRWRKGVIRSSGQCGSDGLVTSNSREYKASVDAGTQCTLKPSNYEGVEPICICGATGGSQQLSMFRS